MSYSFFIGITRRALKAYFAVKSKLFKKYLQRRKLRARFCLSLGWLHISEKKIIENCNSVGAGAQNMEKVVSFWPNFDPDFTDIWERKKGKLHILKKVDLSTFKEIL